ncbi:SDR family oxidoreductase [Catenovulum sp. 2E275]|uniref:SDR family NAD(P)-dependent oxidoreductase n=1 Tax=Catenovulum sp. 2E275 TaxID=2980497 RepID=UPI0021D2A9BB|nr:SDR family oxidoreductase [Catenovulum sp. 2E275]MCU4674752.1 SDR family oxidoreductase [Catenovulum sp. 2E275]
MAKRVFITGATGGIGKACARLYAAQGASLMLTGRDSTKLSELKSQLEDEFAVKVETAILDVNQVDDFKPAFMQVQKQLAGLDILVNCAGTLYESSLMTSKIEDIQLQLQQHLTSSILLAQFASRFMVRNTHGGSMIFISSVVAMQGSAGQSVYACAKSGLHGLTKSLAKELGTQQIRVNLVEPGFIETALVEHYSQDKKQQIAEQTCLKRLGKADDVAQLILFLTSDAASYITGQNFAVDGGLTLTNGTH